VPSLPTTLAVLAIGAIVAVVGLMWSIRIARGRTEPGTWTASRTDVGFVLLVVGLVITIAAGGLASYLVIAA
jgi:hypothetical protein